MGINTQLHTEKGRILGELLDPQGILARLLPQPDDDSFVCLRFIDPYGDTVFNSLQMPPFLEELNRIRHQAKLPEEQELLEQLEALAHRCGSDVHVYLKFVGD